jgi:hypothetical protein
MPVFMSLKALNGTGELTPPATDRVPSRLPRSNKKA